MCKQFRKCASRCLLWIEEKHSLGLPLGLEAPVITPIGVSFLFFLSEEKQKVCRFSDFEQDVWSLYNLEFGDQMGKSTGWRALDEVYRVSTLTYTPYTPIAPHILPS